MKKLTLVLVAILFAVTGILAQTPNEFKYQAVLRNADGTIMANEAVTVDISILQSSATGTSVFTEQHSVTTTAQGLINLNIGSVEDLSVIDWGADTYFIEISVNSTVMGTSQLLSVPYALQAKTAETVDYANVTNTPTIPADVSDLTDNTNLFFDRDYNSLSNLPTLFDGAWSSLTGTAPNISIFNNDEGYLTSFSELDPTFTTNFDLTSVSNGDLLKFNGTKFVKFTPNYLTSYTETDPNFTAWDKTTGISITESQISDFGTYLTSYTETDPIYTTNFDLTSVSNGDLLQYDGSKFVKFTPNYLTSYTETDPIFTAWDKDYADLTNKPANATTTTDGFMSSADKTKLDGLENANITAGTGISVTGTYPNLEIANTAGGSATHYVGELYGGGVVFWVDNTGDHGLIVSMIDLSTSQVWSNIDDTEIGSTAQSEWDGSSNTTAIISQSGHTSSAAKLCADYTNADYGTGTYSDWYLPSIYELNDLWNNIKAVTKALDSDGNSSTTALTRTYYWSSSERVASTAWEFSFSYGNANVDDKSYASYVRGVRAF